MAKNTQHYLSSHVDQIRLFCILCFFLILCSCRHTPSIPRDTFELPLLYPEVIARIPQQPWQNINLEDPGYIVIRDGQSCAQADTSGREEAISFTVTENLPPFAQQATVFLNGWEMKYLHGDHEIGRLGIEIKDIQFVAPDLEWQVFGFLRDQDFKDGYEICAYYTVLGWNESALHLVADDGETGHRNATYSFFPEFGREKTALLSIPSYLINPQFAEHYEVGILPRGFAFGWEEGFDQSDHDLLQMAWHRQTSERLLGPVTELVDLHNYSALEDPRILYPDLQTEGNSLYGAGFVSWISNGIFKDDSAKRDFFFYEVFSGLSGGALSLVETPYVIRPREDVSGGLAYTSQLPGVVRQETFTVQDLPFRYAYPVLSGWDLAFPFKDEEVKRMGIWIHDSQYDYDSSTQTGTLTYQLSSVLHDSEHNQHPHHHATHKVMVLGIDRLSPPDLLPVATNNGTGPQSFCTVNQQGMLILTVRNQGEVAAGAHQLRIDYTDTNGQQERFLSIPEIAAQNEYTVETPIAGLCSGGSTDCHFSIVVDADQAVIETDENNNEAAALCTG